MDGLFVMWMLKKNKGGLLVGWRNHFLLFLNSWAMDSGLCVALYSTELQMEICFVNIYGPYVEREGFWNNLLDFMSANCTKIIFGGDLNFSMGLSKIWGDRARSDCLSDFFAKNLDYHGLVDIVPNVILPTWTNRRVGRDNMCKRLDRLVVSVDLQEFELCFRQWVGCGGYSDHHSVFLQILGHDKKLHSPFKFNPHWMDHEDLFILLKNT